MVVFNLGCKSLAVVFHSAKFDLSNPFIQRLCEMEALKSEVSRQMLLVMDAMLQRKLLRAEMVEEECFAEALDNPEPSNISRVNRDSKSKQQQQQPTTNNQQPTTNKQQTTNNKQQTTNNKQQTTTTTTTTTTATTTTTRRDKVISRVDS